MSRSTGAGSQPPLLSVVVVRSGDRGGSSDELVRLSRVEGVEVVAVGLEMEGARCLGSDGRTPVPALRARGFSAARSERVALTESFCAPGADWLEAALAPFGEAAAVGGPLVRRGGSLAETALTLCEHGRLLAPPRGEVRHLSAANVVYDRSRAVDVLGEVPELWIENDVHDRLRVGGAALRWSPTLVMEDRSTTRPLEALRSQFHHGRLYGATHFAGREARRRLPRAAAAPLGALVAFGRICRGTIVSGRVGQLARSLPLLLPLLGAWAVGELTGGLSGQGESLERWR